jgi:predicted lipid-binding transport protein (Tim44 family)
VERETLRRWIVRESPIPIGRAASAAASVAEAVARRHAEGRPAGDAIDAETIEISWDVEGEPSVFLASALFDVALGDPDPAEDIPRIGAVLYELLAGAPPPARRAPPPVQRDRPDVPEALGELVLACFRPGAPGCPGSAAEVAVRLGPFEGLHVRTRPVPTLRETAPESGVRPTPVRPTPARPTPVRPLEDRTLAHPHEGVEEIAVAEGDPEAPRGRGKLAAGILALAVAAGVLALVVVSTVRNRARPAPVSPAAAVSPAPTAAFTTTDPAPAATSLPAAPAIAAAPVTAVVVAPPPPELSAQPASPPEVTPAAIDAKDAERLREALDAWVESMNAHDLSGHMRLYMPRVATFYRSRNVSRDFVWSEKSRQFGNLVEVRAARPDVVFGPDGQTATVTFRKRVVTTDRSGEIRQDLDWVKTPRGWRIVGER